MFFQLYLQHQEIASCPAWVNRNTLPKLADLNRELAVFIEQRCNCSFPPSLLTTSSQFTCVTELPHHVVYRASVELSSLPASLNRSMLVDILETWPVLHRAVLVQGERLSVEESCAVVILSPQEEGHCTLTSAPPTVPLSTFLITLFVVVILFVLTAVAMVIIAMAIHAAKQRKVASQRCVDHIYIATVYT